MRREVAYVSMTISVLRMWPINAVLVAAMVVDGHVRAQTLLEYHAPQGVFVASRNGAGVVTIDPVAGRLVAWDAAGRLEHSFAVRVESMRSIAARENDAIVCGAGVASTECMLVDLRTGNTRQIHVDSGFQVSAGGERGWVFTDANFGHDERMLLVDDQGQVGLRIVCPSTPTPVERPEGARLLPILAGDELWAVNYGAYEVWRLVPQPPARFEPAREYAANGVVRHGEPVLLRMESRLDDAVDASNRDALAQVIAQRRLLGDRASGYFAPVLARAVERGRLAILIDTRPDGISGRCRLDVWVLPDARIDRSIMIDGVCPTRIALAGDGAWVFQGRSFRWQKF